MLRKNIKKLLCILSAVVIAFSCLCFDVSAASDIIVQMPCASPATGDNNGYVELLVQRSDGSFYVRMYSFYTRQYIIDSTWNEYEASISSVGVNLTINDNSISINISSLTPLADSFSLRFLAIDSKGSYWVRNYLQSVLPVSSSFSDTIVGFRIGGNISSVTSNLTTQYDFNVLYDESAVQYNQLLTVISLINHLAADNDTIISQLNTIISNTDTIETKLQSALNLLTTIETDLDAVNAELDRIEANTDDLESKLDTIIGILDNPEQSVPTPDTSTTDDYASKEQTLINSTSSGRQETASIFNKMGNILSDANRIGRGLLAVTAIIKEFTDVGSIPWLSSLIHFSLGLGSFAFILGISVFIFNRIDFSSERKKRLEDKRDRYGGKK